MRAQLIAAGIVVALVASGAFYMRHLQNERVKAVQQAETAKAQTVVEQATVQAIDRVTITERRITNEVHRVTKQIEALPSGEALVPDDVAAAWSSGIDGLRNDSTKPRSDDTAKPEGLPPVAAP
jgi:hypothetical protein